MSSEGDNHRGDDALGVIPTWGGGVHSPGCALKHRTTCADPGAVLKSLHAVLARDRCGFVRGRWTRSIHSMGLKRHNATACCIVT